MLSWVALSRMAKMLHISLALVVHLFKHHSLSPMRIAPGGACWIVPHLNESSRKNKDDVSISMLTMFSNLPLATWDPGLCKPLHD